MIGEIVSTFVRKFLRSHSKTFELCIKSVCILGQMIAMIL